MDIRLLDSLLIAVPKIFDDGDGEIKTRNLAYYIDKERDRYERKVLCGTIYRSPVAYSQENHMPIDPGIPNPKLHIGHDDIQMMVNMGYDWGNEKYHPGTTEHFKYFSRADYGKMITAKDGDSVYFHPSVTEQDNFVMETDGQFIFRAQVHELIAVGNVPQGGYLLVKPHAADNEINGLSISVDDTDKALEGTVAYCRPGLEFKPGDVVAFQEGSDWSFYIEGERLFAMLEENVLAVEIH